MRADSVIYYADPVLIDGDQCTRTIGGSALPTDPFPSYAGEAEKSVDAQTTLFDPTAMSHRRSMWHASQRDEAGKEQRLERMFQA